MKYPILIVLSSVIVFMIYSVMYYVTKAPPDFWLFDLDETTEVLSTSIDEQKPIKNFNIKKPTIEKPSKNIKSDALKEISKNLFSTDELYSESNKITDSNFTADTLPDSPKDLVGDFITGVDLNSLGVLTSIPFEAYKNKVNGWVLLKIFISTTGSVFDVEVLDSDPKGMFVDMAIKEAYKKVYPIRKDNVDPKKYTRNIKLKYNNEP